jgi:hypothetical protein
MKDPGCIPMYVMTNRIHHYGASSILDREQLRLFSDRLGSDLYILPSSIHEVILVPVSQMADRDRLRAMVRQINETQVPPQEVLSDEVYSYEEFENLMPEEFRHQLQMGA